jgi:multiple sugar transport system permease protein
MPTARVGARGVAGSRKLTPERQRFYRRMLMPALAVLFAVTLAPTGFLIATSLTPLDLTKPETIGDFTRPLRNFHLLIEDRRFLNSLWVQAKLSFWTVSLQLLMGLGFALLLNIRSSLLQALRTVFLIPMVLPPIVVAIIWKVIYTPDISPLYWAIQSLGWRPPALITSADWALTAIIIADSWEWFPFTMLMILAVLQMMPEEHVDAARVDGASPFQMLWFVTLPYLKGVLLVAGLFRLIDSIKAFPLIYILTDGGPGTLTEVTNYYGFVQAFNFSFLGYSSAITVVLVVFTVVLSWLILRLVGWGRDVE